MILKGQNFRLLIQNRNQLRCVGMATNCTVTLTNNTEQAETKDDTGLAAKPTMVSQSWQVQVDSLEMVGISVILSTMQKNIPYVLVWDETSPSNNQDIVGAAFARTGEAYLSDATFQFDDRTNSAKSLTFVGTGPLSKLESGATSTPMDPAGYTKGQFVRLFLGSDNSAEPAKVIAAARTLALHVSLSLENSTTKDTPGSWQVQEPTGLSYDITTSALVRGADNITSSVDGQDLASLEDIYEAGTPVKWKIANVTGDNQRTAASTIVRGSCLITQLSIQAQNRQSATYQATLTGYGDYDTNS